MNPSVSVIIPTFNRAHLVGRAVSSVLAQDYGDLECLVVDDGSTDDTAGAVSRIPDPRVRLVRHDRNGGAAVAKNTGIKAAVGSYLAFLDSDDEWLPNKLSSQMRVYHENPHGFPQLGVVLTLVSTLDTRTGVLTHRRNVAHRGDVRRQVFRRELQGAVTGLFKREYVFAAGLLDESLPVAEDWDMLVRLSRICQFDYVPEHLYFVYQHDGPRLRSNSRALVAYEKLFGKYAREFAEDPAYEAALRSKMSAWWLMEGNRRQAFSAATAALRRNPALPRAWVYLLLSSLPTGVYSRISGRRLDAQVHQI